MAAERIHLQFGCVLLPTHHVVGRQKDLSFTKLDRDLGNKTELWLGKNKQATQQLDLGRDVRRH